MADIHTASDAELAAELERRKRAASIPPPSPLPRPDFSALIQTVMDGMAATLRNGYEDKNYQQYVADAAIEAVYGRGYWTWRRAQPW